MTTDREAPESTAPESAAKQAAEQKQKTRFLPTPPPLDLPLPEPATAQKVEQDAVSPDSLVEVNFDGLSLPAFINEVYGNILHHSFEIDPKLRNKTDLVTLRTAEPQSPAELADLAGRVLANYGVTIESQGELQRFVPVKRGTTVDEPPLLISGRALPETPASHRPVFQEVPLKVVLANQITLWLKSAFKGQDINIIQDMERNVLLLKGPPAIVRQVVTAVELLDRPTMRGRHSLRIEPVFLNAEELAKLLMNVLNSQGYAASLKPPYGGIIMLPVTEVNAVLIFAADEEVLNHVKEWAANLDQPTINKTDKNFFYYRVRNTGAAELADILASIVAQPGALAAAGAGAQQGADIQNQPSIPTQTSSARLIVDETRNGIIFHGTAMEWQGIQSIIREMDIPCKQVMIEVTLAEITLTNQEERGIEWMFDVRGGLDGLQLGEGMEGLEGTLQTLGGLGLGGSGLLYTLDSAGQTRAMLNLLSTHNSASILSAPRIMVKSGMEATINVGSEVPIVTSQASSSEVDIDGTSSILQEIQYRKTGVLLNVKPVVHSGDRVDLEITQEVSEAGTNTTSSVSSPSIFTRKVTSNLSLEDGGSVLLGGLMSSTGGEGNSGIPLLKDIPVLGQFFRVNSKSNQKTELMILIVPYIIDSHQDAVAITEEFRRSLGTLSEKNSRDN